MDKIISPMRLFPPGSERSTLFILASVLFGAALGLLLLPIEGLGKGNTEPPEVRLFDQPLILDDRAEAQAQGRVQGFLRRKFVLKFQSTSKELAMRQLGVELDSARLDRLVRDTKDETSALRRHRHTLTGPLVLPLPVQIDLERAASTLLALKDSLDEAPVDARLDLEAKRVVPEAQGRLLDIDATISQIRKALTRGELSTDAVFETRKPRRTSKELEHIRFNQVLGSFETRYDRAARYEARTFNLRLAASKLDGHVLMPGEIFDFNDVVGPRDESRGYKVAHVIAEGELVDGIGGGTCQISGTLHAAAFFAGLEIVERYPHTRPSAYIKMGLDATVVYPTINFRVRNPYSFPVVLHQTVSAGRVHAAILGPERPRLVTLIRRIEGVIPYEEVQRPDETLPLGTRVLHQRGIPGFRLRRYRILREGQNAIRERFRDTYPPTTQIIRVGTKEKTGKATETLPGGDRTPEYLADELLVMTQTDGNEIQERREPGPYSERGWIKRANMPFFEDERSKP